MYCIRNKRESVSLCPLLLCPVKQLAYSALELSTSSTIPRWLVSWVVKTIINKQRLCTTHHKTQRERLGQGRVGFPEI